VTLKSGLGSFKVIENGTTRKLGYGFLFAFRSNYGRISSRFDTIHERDKIPDTRQTLYDSRGRALCIESRGKKRHSGQACPDVSTVTCAYYVDQCDDGYYGSGACHCDANYTGAQCEFCSDVQMYGLNCSNGEQLLPQFN